MNSVNNSVCEKNKTYSGNEQPSPTSYEYVIAICMTIIIFHCKLCMILGLYSIALGLKDKNNHNTCREVRKGSSHI